MSDRTFDVLVVTTSGKELAFTEVDRVSWVNHESYGQGEKIGNVGSVDDERVLVLNVNAVATAQFDS